MKQPVDTNNAPKALGAYSQAIKANNLVFLSGQVPLVPDTMTLVSDSFEDQAEQVFKNLQAVCEAAGGSIDHIVKLTIYLTDLSVFSIVNEVMERFFTQPFPARVTLQVSALPKQAKIEVEGIMALAG